MASNPSFKKVSGTGNKQSSAKKIPLSAKNSALLATERTTDAEYTAVTGKRPHHAKPQLEGGEQKRRRPQGATSSRKRAA